MEELKNFLKGYSNMQVFFTRNLVGDKMRTIYHDENIYVDICDDWDYLEVFGLTKEQQDEICQNGDIFIE